MISQTMELQRTPAAPDNEPGSQEPRGDGRSLGRWRWTQCWTVAIDAVLDGGMRHYFLYSGRGNPEARQEGQREVVTSELSLQAISRVMELFCISTEVVTTGLCVSVNTHISLCSKD